MQEKQFIQKGARKVRLQEFLQKELEGAGYSHADVVRTPTSTKIVIHAQRPGLVIGRGGSRIKELTQKVENEFDFENPQLEVDEIDNPDGNAQVVADAMAQWLEKGGRAKRVGYTYLRRMKESGVIGAEIEVTGKLSGNRGRTEKFSFGYVKRCGNTSKKNVDHGYALARTKPGAIGVKVRIMKDMPEFMHRDVDVEKELIHETVEGDEAVDQAEKINAIIEEAENMTSSELERAIEELEFIKEGDISKSEVRKVFENKAEEPEPRDSDKEDEEQEEVEIEEDEKTETDVDEEESADESTEEHDYSEIVDSTISDAKEALNGLEGVDWEKALEAEKAHKNRTTFIDWLERQNA